MPKNIVITGTATGMGRAAVSKFAAEGNPLRTSSAAAGAIATVYLVGERNGARSRLQGLRRELCPDIWFHRTGTLQVQEGRSRNP